MSNSIPIEWTDATWNPVTGCTKVTLDRREWHEFPAEGTAE